MLLTPAHQSDLPAVVALANRAYRGNTDQPGWTTEAAYITGPRLTLDLLREDLAHKPHAVLLAARDTPQGDILGTVWLEPKSPTTWYLGLLTIDPALQARQLGRTLLTLAEDFAHTHSATTVRMTVIHIRETLIAWYERRGYQQTGETEPFPYHDQRFGQPTRDDLYFIVLEKQLPATRGAGVHTPSQAFR